MAFENKQNNGSSFRTYPTIILSSYSSIDSKDYYFSIDVWNNRLSFTFGDSSKENSLTISVLLSVDKAVYLNHLIRDIYRKRIDAYLKNEPYQNISEEQAFTIDCIPSALSKDRNASPEANSYKIKIFTTPVDGIPRLTFKLVNNGSNYITVVLGSKVVETSCIDPNNIVRFLDKTDTVVARLSKDLDDITSNITMYKMFAGFFDFFIGPKFKPKKSNNASGKYGSIPQVKTGNYNTNSSPDDITM